MVPFSVGQYGVHSRRPDVPWCLGAARSSHEKETTVGDELHQKAKELDIDLASVNLSIPAEERELFKQFEIAKGDISKKSKLRTLIRDQQQGEC